MISTLLSNKKDYLMAVKSTKSTNTTKHGLCPACSESKKLHKYKIKLTDSTNHQFEIKDFACSQDCANTLGLLSLNIFNI
jgi:hypothetical protein